MKLSYLPFSLFCVLLECGFSNAACSQVRGLTFSLECNDSLDSFPDKLLLSLYSQANIVAGNMFESYFCKGEMCGEFRIETCQDTAVEYLNNIYARLEIKCPGKDRRFKLKAQNESISELTENGESFDSYFMECDELTSQIASSFSTNWSYVDLIVAMIVICLLLL